MRLPAQALWATFASTAVMLASCSGPVGANVAATVNGRAITFAELDKQYQFQQFGSFETGASEEELAIQRLEILRAMIDSEIMLQRAENEGLLASDDDIEARFAELKAPYTEIEFQEELNNRKMTVDELKAQLRRDISVQKLLNKETTAKINITDQDIKEFYEANQASFNRAEPQLHLAQILVTPYLEPNLRNLQNDNAEDEETAREKIEMIYDRLKQGEDFNELALNFSEDPDSSPAGGDLGFIAESALDKADVELRRQIQTLNPGEFTTVLENEDGFRILKLMAKEPAGQRDVTDPNVQQTIRDTLINRRDQILKAAFYEVARNEAQVVNYLALDLVKGAK